MQDSEGDVATIAAILERFLNQRLPRMQAIKEKVDKGELLGDFDIEFLEQIASSAAEFKPLARRHPEYHELVGKAYHLYREIIDKALENEKNSS